MYICCGYVNTYTLWLCMYVYKLWRYMYTYTSMYIYLHCGCICIHTHCDYTYLCIHCVWERASEWKREKLTDWLFLVSLWNRWLALKEAGQRGNSFFFFSVQQVARSPRSRAARRMIFLFYFIILYYLFNRWLALEMGKFTSIQSHLQADFFLKKIIHFFLLSCSNRWFALEEAGQRRGCVYVCVCAWEHWFVFPLFWWSNRWLALKGAGQRRDSFFFLESDRLAQTAQRVFAFAVWPPHSLCRRKRQVYTPAKDYM